MRATIVNTLIVVALLCHINDEKINKTVAVVHGSIFMIHYIWVINLSVRTDLGRKHHIN